jgi:microcystin-dependent protein
MNPYIGEIRAVGFNFAPTGWAMCNGQLLPITQNTALFSLLGTFYGGDGRTTFALPNLQAATPRGAGQGPGLSYVSIGEQAGSATVSLLQTEIPAHAHAVYTTSSSGSSGDPTNATLAEARNGRVSQSLYATAPDGHTTMSTGALAVAGGGQPHNNMPPYLVLNFIIALQGVFPPRS